MNIFNTCSINNSVTNNVNDLYKLDSEVEVSNKTEVLDNRDLGQKL